MKTLIESAAAAKAAGSSRRPAHDGAEERSAARHGRRAGGALRRDTRRQRGGHGARAGKRHEPRHARPANAQRKARRPTWPWACRQVAELPDPIGEVMAEWTRPNGLNIRKVRVPMGVIGIIYEAQAQRHGGRRVAGLQGRQRHTAARQRLGL